VEHPDLTGVATTAKNQTGFSNLQSVAPPRVTVNAFPDKPMPSDISDFFFTPRFWHYGTRRTVRDDQQTDQISQGRAAEYYHRARRSLTARPENGADAAISIPDSFCWVVSESVAWENIGLVSAPPMRQSTRTAVGNVATYKKALTTLAYRSPGGLSNVTRRNVFARGPVETPVAAVWGSRDVIGGGQWRLLRT